MKILVYFSGKLFESKGTPIRTRNTIEQLQNNEADVYYAGYDIPVNVEAARTLKLRHPFMRGFQLAHFVRKHKIDVVYFQTSAGIWFAPFIRLCTSAKAGVDFHSRVFQEEHIYKKRSSLITTCLESLEMSFTHFLHFGTAVSSTLENYYKKHIAYFQTIPVGVDTKKFSPETKPDAEIVRWKGEAILMAYAGNTKWYQGVGDVLEAFHKAAERAPNVFKLLLITSSGYEDILAFVKEKKLDEAVKVLSKQPHDKIPSLLAGADILTVVRPSDMVTEFSFPSKLSEYAALGKTLLVSDVSDIGSYIISGQNGIIVPPNDSEALCDAVLDLQDVATREALGAHARVLAEKQFDLSLLGIELNTFLQSIVS